MNKVCVSLQVLELLQRLQTSQPSDDANSVKSAASNADSGRGASDEGDVRQRLLRAAGSGNLPLADRFCFTHVLSIYQKANI